MSSSSRSVTRHALRTWWSGLCLFGVGLEVVSAQELAFVPQGEVSAEWASNRTLTHDQVQSIVGGDAKVKPSGQKLHVARRRGF